MNGKAPIIRAFASGEELLVHEFACRVYLEEVASETSAEALAHFLRHIDPQRLKLRLEQGFALYLAFNGEDLLGLLEFGRDHHITMFFMDKLLPIQGVGNQLMEKAVAAAKQTENTDSHFTIHAPLGEVETYEQLGFATSGPMEVENGLRYLPMRYDIH